jgi:DNA modification methylase
MYLPDQIINDDILVVLPSIPSESIDLIIADIPYFGIVDDGWDNQWANLDDYLSWLDKIFCEFARILKQDTACYVYSSITNYPHVQLTLNRHLAYAYTITWKKQRSRGNGWGFNREEICVNIKGNHVFKDVETQTLMLPHLRKGKIDYSNGRRTLRKRDYKLATSVWDDIAQICSYRKQLHPTEKPVENARRIIQASSNAGDIVLIPFVGSGSELEACIRCDRHYIGVEASADYCKIASDRLLQIISSDRDV